MSRLIVFLDTPPVPCEVLRIFGITECVTAEAVGEFCKTPSPDPVFGGIERNTRP